MHAPVRLAFRGVPKVSSGDSGANASKGRKRDWDTNASGGMLARLVGAQTKRKIQAQPNQEWKPMQIGGSTCTLHTLNTN